VLIEAEEKQLLAVATKSEIDIKPLLEGQDYQAALQRLAHLRSDVDSFFDKVMVMSDDLNLRSHRLALLSMLSDQFLQIADISKLQS